MHQHFRPLQLRANETRQSETSRQTIPYKRFSLPKRKEKFFFGARCRFPLPETIKLGPTLNRLNSNKSLKKVIYSWKHSLVPTSSQHITRTYGIFQSLRHSLFLKSKQPLLNADKAAFLKHILGTRSHSFSHPHVELGRGSNLSLSQSSRERRG